MKLKYYLRGLGIGMIVTALLMGVSSSKQVKAEPVQPVVAEQETSEQITTEEMTITAEQTTEMASVEETQTQQSETEQESTLQSEETGTWTEETATAVTEETLTAEVEIAEDASESYLLNIVKGDDSGTVSRKLQNAGLIENATEFDAFLMQHGYDKKISVGVVEIPLNATWMEIAQRLSGSKE